ncbi:MAG: hypothetical protein PHR35_23025, partial [Kiritimatiellae bacterium]|nr:hypothetical protein [Kiritimatiellia bacterium]
RFRVPANIDLVTMLLKGKVRNLSQNRDDDVSAGATLDLNGLLSTTQVESLLLRRTAEGYVLDARGCNGEALPSRTVRLACKHRSFTDAIDLVLQGDAQGRIMLGALPGIVRLTSTDFAAYSWTLDDDTRISLPSELNVLAGEAVELPATGIDLANPRGGLSLLGCAESGVFTEDLLGQVKLEGGVLRIDGLVPGDYQLAFRESGRKVAIRVTRGVVAANAYAGAARGLEITPSRPLLIDAMEVRGDKLHLRLRQATPETRVHLLARRTACGDDPFDGYAAGLPGISAARWNWPLPPGSYLSGRAVGDEARYVLDRRDAARFPGNMLERPSLILTPWSRKTTETDVLQAAAGEEWDAEAAPRSMKALRRAGGAGAARQESMGGELSTRSSVLDFLPTAARLWPNLRPDTNGVIEVPLAELGGRQEVVALAADALTAVSRRLALTESPMSPRDLRLTKALPAKELFAERKLAEGLAAGVPFKVADLPSARVEVYDTVAKVFRLLQSLSRDATLEDFAFVTEWPTLPPARQEELYGKFACHELDFFLYHKDRAFFDRVVKPHLANKRDKQFMDLWLLGADLNAYCEPALFQQLNYMERVLLGRSVATRRADMARHVEDHCNLLPPDPDGDERRFQTALRSGGMEGGGDLAEAVALGEVAADMPSEASEQRMVAEPSAPPAPAAPKPVLLVRKSDLKGKSKGLELEDSAVAMAGAVREKDAKRRLRARQLYREPEQTREWLETHYYQLPLDEQTPERVPINAFWRDYGVAPDDRPFLSGNVAAAAGSFTERLCALAVLDVPFQAQTHREDVTGAQYTLTPASHAVVFHRQVVAAAPGDATRPVMAVENFFDLADRYRIVGSERVDKFVRDEFVAGRVYGAQVVLTNPTSSRRRLSLLVQVPEGALPLAGG